MEKPSEELSERAIFAKVLRHMRLARDLTQEEASDLAKLQPGSWWRYEKDKRNLDFDKVRPLAEALGFTADDVRQMRSAFLAGQTPQAIARGPAAVLPFPNLAGSRLPAGLPIGDRVQAGAWLEADDTDQRPPRTYPVMPDPRYPEAPQWLAPVVGDSVDLLRIFDGDMVHCVDADAIHYAPRSDDIVVVLRTRASGRERQLTIKQVEVASSGDVRLWPRSSNPKWSEPITIHEVGDDPESVEVRIHGLVLRTIRDL